MGWEGTGGRAETRERTKRPSSDHSSQRISRPSQVEVVGMQAAPHWCLQDSGLCPPAAKVSTWGPEIKLLMQDCGEPVPSAWNYKSAPEKYILVWYSGNVFGTGRESMECGTCWDSTEARTVQVPRATGANLSHLVHTSCREEFLKRATPRNKSVFYPRRNQLVLSKREKS